MLEVLLCGTDLIHFKITYKQNKEIIAPDKLFHMSQYVAHQNGALNFLQIRQCNLNATGRQYEVCKSDSEQDVKTLLPLFSCENSANAQI